jgi:hypothetical protein
MLGNCREVVHLGGETYAWCGGDCLTGRIGLKAIAEAKWEAMVEVGLKAMTEAEWKAVAEEGLKLTPGSNAEFEQYKNYIGFRCIVTLEKYRQSLANEGLAAKRAERSDRDSQLDSAPKEG